MLESSWAAAQLAASQEGLSSISDWVSYYYAVNWKITISVSPEPKSVEFAENVVHINVCLCEVSNQWLETKISYYPVILNFVDYQV
jgi:hypothetical protein